MGGKRRKRKEERPSIHPKNKYSENPPDFALLASLYPSFQPFVFYSRDGRPRIDWTDFNATRELTRVLLLHDHGLNWWIPDGQLCPTVPNRSNYIHWLEDLLSSDIIPNTFATGDKVRGFDIGTGANCIYPLLGASLLGWSFVGSDVTDIALDWAEKNVSSNPHISDLIEIRKVEGTKNTLGLEGSHHEGFLHGRSMVDLSENEDIEVTPVSSLPLDLHAQRNKSYHGPPILLGVVRDDEKFDFCMCNPPFFESLEEAGLNPKTSCGGTSEEMVCLGGEQAFIIRIIEDSVKLQHSFRWYTSMVGRKSNLKYLISKLWEVGVTIVKTTEFVQGKTCRWGLAWSFLPPVQKKLSTSVPEKNNLSLMLELLLPPPSEMLSNHPSQGNLTAACLCNSPIQKNEWFLNDVYLGLQRQHGAIHVLQAVESYFCLLGLSCTFNATSFAVDVAASKDQCDSILKNELPLRQIPSGSEPVREASTGSCSLNPSTGMLRFRVMVFQQNPGSLLVKGSLQDRNSFLSGAFSLIFQKMEEALRSKFLYR